VWIVAGEAGVALKLPVQKARDFFASIVLSWWFIALARCSLKYLRELELSFYQFFVASLAHVPTSIDSYFRYDP
jgi:hypothetical protein